MKRLRSAAPWVFVVVASAIATVWSHELWSGHLGLPLAYSADSIPHGVAVKQVIDNGWFWSDPRLGAPIGQNFQDWPLPDILMLLQARILGLFSDNWAAVTNVLYLVTYPVVALSACWVMTRLGVAKWTAAVLGVLYTMLPYHVVRGEHHLFLSGYFTVPLGAFLALRVLSGETLIDRRAGNSSLWRSYFTWNNFRTAVFCLLIATSGVYYTAFTLILLVFAGSARVMMQRSWRPAATTAVLMTLLVFGVLFSTAGTLAYHFENGDNPSSAARSAGDTDRYGLKLAQMLLPVADHRLSAWSDIRADYLNEFPLPSEGWATPLGIVGSLGLVWLLGLALFGTVMRRSFAGDRHRHLAFLSVGAFLVATIGGISTFISLFVLTEIRSWNRISIFIGFFALVAVGLGVDQLIRHLRNRASGRKRLCVAPVLLAGLLVGGVLDQTNSSWVPPYKDIEDQYFADQVFFGEMEDLMPEGAAIYQLPQMTFPESSPLNDVEAYGHLRGYLNTDDLRWSFGGIRGRFESSWQARLEDQTVSALLNDLVAVGYLGLYIDRGGFADDAALFEFEVQDELGVRHPTLVSPDAQRSFYDLRWYADALRATNATELKERQSDLLFPVLEVEGVGFYGDEVEGELSYRWAIGQDATLLIENTSDDGQMVAISFSLETAGEALSRFEITWPDGSVEVVEAGASPLFVSHRMSLAPGRFAIGIESNAPRLSPEIDERQLHFRVQNFTVSAA